MYVPNGSGLQLVNSPFQGRGFSATDGTGYLPTKRCFKTGFALSSDKLIFPDIPSNWTVTGSSYWTSPPYHTHTNTNASVGTYMAALSAVGDQWCVANVTQLSNNIAGIGIGVMNRFVPGSVGYYGLAGLDSGNNKILEIGTFNSNTNSTSIAHQVAWPGLATAPFIMLKTTGTNPSINVQLYAGTALDFIKGTLTLYTSFTPVVNQNNTGIVGAIGSSGGNGRDFADANQTNWMGGIIGGC